MICGLPRNDILIHNDDETKEKYKQKINIPKDKKVILYAPTFREYVRDRKLNCVLEPPVNFGFWEEKLGSGYVVLLRCHYEVSKVMNISTDNEFVFDVSEYPVLNELMLASDMLISDYSSIIYDYSCLDRFRKQYVSEYGHATERVVDEIYKKLVDNPPM